MVDISLHTYFANPVESLSGFNAPHKYRVAQRNGYANNLENYLKYWDTTKQRVLEKFVCAIRVKFNTNGVFAIAVAPSNTMPFNRDIHKHLINVFCNAIDLTNCFSKDDNFEAITQNSLLTDEQLRRQFFIDLDCLNGKMLNQINSILLVDDIYSFGNTFKGMELLIRDILPDVEITKAVILKTT